MNICILKESLEIGGTERSAANISKALAHTHFVCMALYDGKKVNYSCGGQVIDFCLPPKQLHIGKLYNTFAREMKLRRLLKEKNIDILFTFTGIRNAQTTLKYNNVVKLISGRDYGKMFEKHRKFHKALLNSDAMICNSEYLRKFYLSLYPEHENKVYSVYNIIDRDEIWRQLQEVVEQEFIDFLAKHSQTIVSVGRFCKEKGFEYLIEAFATVRNNISNVGLVLVGDGSEYKEKYQTLIGQFELENHVYFTGFQKNPYKYMVKCSCFVLSSLSEGFPNVLAEAMALGLPVISTNCLSGPAEILRKDGDYEAVTDQFEQCDYGLLSPRLTEENNYNAICQLGNAISMLLSNKEMMNQYALLSKQRASDFSQDSIRIKLNEILNELVERRKAK